MLLGLMQDPLAAGAYAADFFGYLRQVEASFRPLPSYMQQQVASACMLIFHALASTSILPKLTRRKRLQVGNHTCGR